MSDGVVVVDKPAGWTSHDVVARVRRLAGTRRVGHAGTLDPMATGVLVIGIGRATRLLGYLTGHDKTYETTIRLGQSTSTDDAEGSVVASVAVDVDASAIESAVLGFVGALSQVPPAVSAVKVDGRRSYARARAGEEVSLQPRDVVVHRFDVRNVRSGPEATVDVDALVVCSAGTYVRALARDVGAALGVGGHVVALRRTASGPFLIEQARTLDQLENDFALLALAPVVDMTFPRLDVSDEDAQVLAHGGRLKAGQTGLGQTFGAFDPGGQVVALVTERAGELRPVCVLAPQ